jgi:hypothetical protein
MSSPRETLRVFGVFPSASTIEDRPSTGSAVGRSSDSMSHMTASRRAVARNARQEAASRVDDGYEVRVLEPSGPAVVDDWYADDPTAVGEVESGRRLLTPLDNGDLTWGELAQSDVGVSQFAQERWLGAYRRLEPLPNTWVETRTELHRLATYVLSPARTKANGKLALRFTLDGFGTPFFGEDEQVRLQGLELVRQRGDRVETARLTTLREAAELVGVGIDPALADGMHDVPAAGDIDAPLRVDPAAAHALADWFGFAYSVLEQIRSEARPDEQPSRVQLWAEHFDPAFEAGAEAAGRRAGFGASPGDSSSEEPYLYFSLWYRDRVPDDQFWNASFGATMGYAELLAADDQRARALAFFRTGRHILRS